MTNLFTEPQLQQLLANASTDQSAKDHLPVVRLSLPGSNAAWLLTELGPDNTDLAFGLCDLGLGFPELGYLSMDELKDAAAYFGSTLFNDPDFAPRYPISIYARAARMAGAITFDERLLYIAANKAGEFPRRAPGLIP